ncbi:SusC/RagA family TonB-linked outer membrane protein [Pedobacter sp. SD-b]|uniref:SusC/RagA family TonB-linked outer membrane protein n=1 Tax=Pedobacter segetis TaxID=2793069 RepID=A0ABS1BJM1_9SPHI|nr:SusC/RagA family TonB-linked outer membrane protein [Pedobacter segetis]MBK0383074.1 SusC/RagA family TonB-linked outer membrane protein [Pedobacter segetis]
MLKNIFMGLYSHIKMPGKMVCMLLGLSTISYNTQAQSKIKETDSLINQHPQIIKIKADSIAILYGQKSENKLNVAALGYLNGRALESTPNSFIFQGLTGRIAGLRTTQDSGIPGSDNVSLTLRGRSPAILVDGVPRDISELNPEQISSVTVLKDAISTVTLGQRSMNGAILITTRKGESNGPDYFNFNVKTQAGIQSPVVSRRYLNAFDYSTLYNEALANDGKAPLYTPADLQAYKDGSDPYLHPNVDWQKQIYKNNAGYSRTNLYADGKSKSLRYMLSMDYLDQGGLLNELDSNSYETNASYKRYILRSNINLQLTKTLEGYLNLYGRVNDTNAPAGGNLTAVTSELNITPNNAYPVYNPNGTLGGNINYSNNLWGRSTYNGYFQSLTREGFFDFGLKQSLDNLTKGLSIGGKLSFSSFTNLNTNRSKAFGVVNYSVDANGNPVYTTLSSANNQSNTSNVSASQQTSYAKFTANYNRRFNKNGITAFLTANSENYKNFVGDFLPRVLTNYAASLKYDFDKKYIIEGAAAYSGLNYYVDGQQYGFFPAVGLGWNINNEGFMKSVKFIDALKLRGSYGLTGSINAGNFDNQKGYVGGGNYPFGPSGSNLNSLVEGAIPFNNTWSQSLKTDVGLDASLLKNQLWVSFDYFLNKQSKLPITTGYDSGILGSTYPTSFIGKNDIKGIESEIGFTTNKTRKLVYSVAANFSTYQVKTIFNGEQTAGYQNLIRTGQYTNQNYGYIADGFVTTAGQGPVITGYASKPGDIKYKDLNGDNTIDYRDVTAIGKAKPIINYGLSSQFSYNKFCLSFLVQGLANTNEMLSGNTVFPFLNAPNGGISQAFPESLNRWTPQTANTATFPRLTIGGNPNNYAASSFWLRSTSYVRLKNIELGYNFSPKLLDKIKVKNIRLFVNGENLFTHSDFKIFDPEMPFSDYSILKVVNGGLSVTF